MVDLNMVLWLGGLISLIGMLGLLLRKNLVVMLMSLELMLLGAVMVLLGAARMTPAAGIADGALLIPFVFVVAACEVCLGLSLVMNIFKKQKTFWVDEIDAQENETT